MNKLIFLFAISIVFLISCKEDTGDCADDLGTFTMLPSSISQVPYGSVSSVVFVDTFGTELHFTITKTEEFTVKGPIIDGPEYCYTTHQLSYLLRDDSLDIDLAVILMATPARFSPTEVYSPDILNITYHDPNPAVVSYGVFNKILNDGGAPVNFTPNMVFDSIVILGRTFLAVEQTHYTNPHNWLVFNSTEGIVAFEDDFGNRWRFERFE